VTRLRPLVAEADRIRIAQSAVVAERIADRAGTVDAQDVLLKPQMGCADLGRRRAKVEIDRALGEPEGDGLIVSLVGGSCQLHSVHSVSTGRFQ